MAETHTARCAPCGPEGQHAMSEEALLAERMTALVGEAAAALADVYEPAGVLIFWSSRIKYLDGKRPCDVYRDGDIDLMERLVQRVNALADGAFL